MTNQKTYKAIKASIFNPIDLELSDFFDNGLLIYDNDGKIVYCGNYDSCPYDKEILQLIDYSDSYIIPGLIDTHTHLPQVSAIGLGSGKLLEWLENYIFPLEKKFTDLDFAYSQSEFFFNSMLKSGTTTAAIYSALDLESTNIAFAVANESKIRAYIGSPLMDLPNNSQYYQSIDANINKMNKILSKWHKFTNKLELVVTPRFAGSCSFDLLKYAGDFANQNNLIIQTHISENISELAFIKNLHPNFKNYTDIYYSAGLLTDRTLLAHSIYLNNNEINLIKTQNCTICHCPTSNRYLSSGVMPLMNYLEMDMKIVLGTDVAGGFSLSVINEMKEAIENTKIYNIFNNSEKVLKPQNSLYLATKAGATALNNDKIGSLENDKYADFVVLKPNFQFNDLNSTEILGKIIYSQNLFDINSVYIQGEKII